jgi:hypothetical protein
LSYWEQDISFKVIPHPVIYILQPGHISFSFHHLPVVHSAINPVKDESIDEMRVLMCQSTLNTPVLLLKPSTQEPFGDILETNHKKYYEKEMEDTFLRKYLSSHITCLLA